MDIIDVNGINLSYEIHGTGRPMILLRGGLILDFIDAGR